MAGKDELISLLLRDAAFIRLDHEFFELNSEDHAVLIQIGTSKDCNYNYVGVSASVRHCEALELGEALVVISARAHFLPTCWRFDYDEVNGKYIINLWLYQSVEVMSANSLISELKKLPKYLQMLRSNSVNETEVKNVA